MTNTAICLFCHIEEVPIEKWNMRCEKCKEKQKLLDEQEKRMTIGKRMPAAIIETDKGDKIYVDKFGEPVDNPGYDLKNDPRGWRKTGTLPKKREVIT